MKRVLLTVPLAVWLGLACTPSVTVFQGAGGGGDDVPGCDPDACRGDDPCLVGRCDDDGGCSSAPAADGTACDTDLDAGGYCLAGQCIIGCAPGSCEDGNPCTVDLCDEMTAYQCTFVPSAGPPPDDGNPCTIDSCSMGAPVYVQASIGTKCGQLTPAIDLLCDGEGDCVECLGPSDCQHLAPDTECATRVCSDGGCQLSYAPSGTELSMPLQTSGDCRLAVCDGSGGVSLSVDNGDVPDDGDACTIDSCQAGIAVFEPKCMPGQQCFNGNCF